VAANQFQVVDWLSAEALRGLVNNLAIASHFNTDYNKEYTKSFAVGETVRVPLPQQFVVTTGLGYKPQGLNRIFTTVTVDQIFGIHFEYDSIEEALKLERGREAFKKNYLDKAMAQLAQEIDSRCAAWALANTNNIVGALGTTPTSFDIYGQARARLIENACPPGDKGMIISPQMMRTIVSNNLTNFNPQNEVAKAFREGYYGTAEGFEWDESMSLYAQTAGTWQNAVTVNTAPATGASSMVVNCTSGDTFVANDVFAVAGVNNANPKTRRSTGTLKQFSLTQNITATGSTATIYFQAGTQGIQGPGSQYQNVDALPVANAALTLYPGTTSPNGKSGINGLAIHRDAYALVGVDLEIPKACEMSSRARDPQTGISVAFFRMMDPETRKMVNRFDVLIGLGNLYPDNCAVRILSLQ
jgi:hypothetical protein